MKLFVASLLSLFICGTGFTMSDVVLVEPVMMTPAEGDDDDGCDGGCPLPESVLNEGGCDGGCPDHGDDNGDGDGKEVQHGCGGSCPEDGDDHGDDNGNGGKEVRGGCDGGCPDHGDDNGDGDKE